MHVDIVHVFVFVEPMAVEGYVKLYQQGNKIMDKISEVVRGHATPLGKTLSTGSVEIDFFKQVVIIWPSSR